MTLRTTVGSMEPIEPMQTVHTALKGYKKSKSIFGIWLQSGLLIIKISSNQTEVVILAPKAILQQLQTTCNLLRKSQFS